jgi:hypothetical protein
VRFLSIGFSRDHDAAFMNKIAQVGSNMGNFFYIDTSGANYQQDVMTSLEESLEIAIEGSTSINLKLKGKDVEHTHQMKVINTFTDELEPKVNGYEAST